MAATPIPLVIAEATEVAHVKGVDAASNLAANVNAAAEALDNLKSLLRHQFPDPDPGEAPKGTRTFPQGHFDIRKSA